MGILGKMNIFQQTRRSFFASLGLTITAGCLPLPMADPESLSPEPSSAPTADPFRQRLDRVLNDGFARRLTVADNAAWQVLHGILAFRRDFLLDTAEGRVPAVDYLLSDGRLTGWDPMIGDNHGTPPRRGVRFDVEAGSLSGQGHRDQWLAVMAVVGLPLETPCTFGGRDYQWRDVLSQALWDVPRNVEQEFSWTVAGVSYYLPSDFEWPARDGNRWSLAQLVQIEADASLQLAACGGTHRLTGLAKAVKKRRSEGNAISGVWQQAEELTLAAIEDFQHFQNGDGSFSSNYLGRRGWSPDLADVLRTTGHILEFIAIAGSDAVLQSDSLRGAATRLCQLFEATRMVELECGALYHALNGLLLYRQRMFPADPWRVPQDGRTTA